MGLGVVNKKKMEREGCSRGSESGWMVEGEIPLEIVLMEIMSRLPVKPLARFRSVCKAFNSVISSNPEFAVLQMKNSSAIRTRFDRQRVMLWDSYNCSRVSFLVKKNSTVFSFERINTSPIEPYSTRQIVASCDGLVCVLNLKTNSILFWNPLTGETKRVPDPPTGIPVLSKWYDYGLGYDSSTDDYKLVCVKTYEPEVSRPYEGGVFSLRTNSWRRVQYCSETEICSINLGVFCNGALYWIGFSPEDGWYDRYKVVSFCLEKEKYTLLDVPAMDFTSCSDFGIQILGDELAFHYRCNEDGSYHLWFLNLHDNNESWMKHVVTLPNSKGFTPLCLLENVDQILFQETERGGQLGVYHLRPGTFRHLHPPAVPEFTRTLTFYESLISPNTYKGTKI